MGFFNEQRFKITGTPGTVGLSGLQRFQGEPTLVCGGRDFVNRELVDLVLDAMRPSIVIEGGYRGADTLARQWANATDTHCATVPALWDTYGGRAGPMRNRAMLLLRPGVVVAFPGDRGTRDMCAAARVAGVMLIRVLAPEG